MKFKVGDKIKTLPAIDTSWDGYLVKPLAGLSGTVVHVDHPDEMKSGMWPYRVELLGMSGSYLVDDTEIVMLDVEG